MQKVSNIYEDSDQERYLLERSLIIYSEEMDDLYAQLKESETRYALAAQGSNDGLWDWDLTSDKVYYSARWVEIMGIVPEPDKVPCRDCWLDLVHPEDIPVMKDALKAHLKGQTKHFENEHRILHQDGDYHWVLSRGLAVRDEKGKALRLAGSLTDITERKRAEEKLEHDAVHDALTGLPNRKRLIERLTRSLERKKLNGDYGFAVLFIDLDRFKTINDSIGHKAGDELLLHVAQRLRKTMRPTDMIARLGGDEFVILVENVVKPKQIARLTQRILNDLQKPVMISGQEIYPSASIGIVVGKTEYNTADELIRDADIAMYRAKSAGKSRFEIFDSKMHLGVVSMLHLEMDLRKALERKELYLNYQPIVAIESDSIIGFEALIRWNHTSRGLVSPEDFIPLAEETELILPIGEWVLREACRQTKEWQTQNLFAENLIISVNLSVRQIEQPNFVEVVTKILRETRLDPASLKLEITESAIMTNADKNLTKINQLREMGIAISIDDFGTGYSSLSYLHRFPIDTLKVDRSFINRIGVDGEHSEIIHTIIKMAASLGLNVVAEGVETVEQLNFLREINCDFGQGFYYSRPMSSLAATEMIEKLRETEFAFPQSVLLTV